MSRTVTKNLLGVWLLLPVTILLFISTSENVNGQLSGVKVIPGDYVSISAFVTALNASGVGPGGVTLDVPAGYTETAPSGGIVITSTGTFGKPVIIQKSGSGANPVITAPVGTSLTVDGIVKLSGVDYITFDRIDLHESVSNTNATTQMEWGFALLKTDGNNGSNHNTIINCSITLNKTNTGSVGIYAANHTISSATLLTYSGSNSNLSEIDSSMNGYNTFYGDTISNAYIGISIKGNTASAGVHSLSDTLNRIGVIGQAANSITLFGGSGIATSAILVTNNRAISVDNNTISGGTGTTSTVGGINISAGVWGEIGYNTVTLASSSTGSAMTGIAINFVGGDAVNPNIVKIRNNTVQNSSYTSATIATFTGISYICGGSGSIDTTTDNIVQNNTLSGTGAFIGMLHSGSTTLLFIARNTISGNTKTAGGTMTGITTNPSATGAYFSVQSNRICNLSAGTSTGVVRGIVLSSSSATYDVYNNVIGGLNASAANPGSPATVINGIDISSTSSVTTFNISFNTINLSGSGGGGNFGSSGINASVTPTLSLRNNIIINNITPGTSGKSVCYRRASTSLATYALNSNNNLFYAGIPSSSKLIFFDGTNSDSTLADFQLRVAPSDNQSKTESVSFQSTTCGNFLFLHPSTTLATLVESGGIPLPGITSDINGTLRSTVAPDLGAYEDNYINQVLVISDATASPSTGQCVAVNHTVNASVLPGGFPVSSVTLNYTYNGTPQSPVSMTHTSGVNWQAVIPAASPSNARVTWTVSATDGTTSLIVTGVSYQDVYMSNNSMNVSSSASTVCANSILTLSSLVSGPQSLPSGYASSGATITSDEDILGVSFATLNNISTCSTTGGAGSVLNSYSNYTGIAAPNIVAGTTYPFTITIGTCGGNFANHFAIFIDYNRNGSFADAGEVAYIDTFSLTGPHTVSGTITVPSGASIGKTMMRVVEVETSAPVSPTGSYSFGETEDYSVNILNNQGFTFSWNEGIDNVGTGATVNTTPLTAGSKTYTIAATDLNGCSMTGTVNVTVNTSSPAPSVVLSPSNQCGIGTPAVSVSGTGTPGNVFRWYLVASGGSPISGQSLDHLVSYPVSSTTHFWVLEYNASSTCEGPSTEVIANVVTPDVVNASATPASICPGSSVVLNMSYTPVANNYNSIVWTATPSTNSGIPVSVSGYPVSINPIAPGTYVYQVTATETSTGCVATASTSVIVHSLPVIQTVSANPSTPICAGSYVSLSANTNIEVPGTAAVGNGTVVNTVITFPSPYGQYYTGNRTQMILPSSELIASGLRAGNITSLAFDVVSPAGTYLNFKISLGNTALSSLTSSFQGGLTLVSSSASFTPVAGINTHPFNITSFFWNGTSNIIVETAFQNCTTCPGTPCTSFSNNAVMHQSNTGYVSTLDSSADFNCSITSVPTGHTYNIRPNMILGGQVASAGAGTYNWVWNPGSLSGNSVDVNPGTSTDYTVTATDPATTCTATGTIHVSVIPVPVGPTGFNGVHCGTMTPNCHVTGGVGSTFNWYLSNSIPTAIAGQNLDHLSGYPVSSTTTFYVSEIIGGCESNRTAVTETVNIPDAVIAGISSGTHCIGLPITLTSTQQGSLNVYTSDWVSSPSAGSGIPSHLGGNPITITPSSAGTYIYTVTASESGTGCSATSSLTVTISTFPQVTGISASPNPACPGASVSLSAISAPESSGNVQVGNGTVQNTSTTFPSPYGQWYTGARSQMLIPASELSAAGLLAGPLTSLSFDVVSPGGSLTNYSISVGTTSLTTLIGGAFQSGLNLVYSNASYTPVAGLNTHTFNAGSFTWNGTSNIIVETSFLNCLTCPGTSCTSFSSSAIVNQSTTSYVSTLDYYADNDCNIMTAAFGNIYAQRPNIRFTGQVITDVTSQLTWIWNPGGMNGASVTTNPLATTTYTVTASNSGGCTATSTILLNVLPVTPAPGGSGSTQCGLHTPSCSVSGVGPYSWYLSSSGGSPIPGQTLDHLVAYPISVPTHFYVTQTSGGCESVRTDVFADVTPTDAITVSAFPSPFCIGSSINLNAAQTGSTKLYSFNWTASPSAGSGIPVSQPGQNISISPSIDGTYTYTVIATDAGCTTASSVTVTGLPSLPITSASASPSTLCIGSATTLTALPLGTGTYSWQWSPGIGTSGNVVTVSPASSTNYTVTATAGNGCTTTAVVPVTVLTAVPTPQAHATPDSVCISESTTLSVINYVSTIVYQWQESSTGNPGSWTNISGGTGSPFTTSAFSSNKHFRVYGSCNGSADTSSAIVVIAKHPSFTSANAPVLCGGGIVTLTVTGTGTFDWYAASTGGTALQNNSSSYQVLVTSTTTFWVQAHIGSCLDTSGRHPVLVTVNSSPTIAVSTSLDSLCPGGNINLFVNSSNDPKYKYTWTSSPAGFNGNGSSVIANPVVTTTYQVAALDTSTGTFSGCQAFGSVLVTVNPVPVVTASASLSTVCQGHPDSLYSTGTNSFTVTPGFSTTVPVPIPDLSPGVLSPIIVSGIPTPALAPGSIISVSIDSLVHTFDGDLIIRLIAPGGQAMTLSNRRAGGGANFIHTVFTPTATNLMSGAVAPNTGTFSPDTAARADSAFFVFNGVNPNGTWQLFISDNQGGDIGTLYGWSLSFSITASVSWSWSSSPSGFTSTLGSPGNIIPGSSGNNTYSVIATNNYGCTATSSVAINVLPFSAGTIAASQTLPFCPGDSILLTASPGYVSYNWSNGPTTETDWIKSGGIYTVTVSDGSCSGTVTRSVVAFPVQPIGITPSSTTTYCAFSGKSLALVADSGYSDYLWNPLGVTSEMITVSPDTTTLYTVSGKDQNGCTQTGTYLVNVFPSPPEPLVNGSSTICWNGTDSTSRTIMSLDTTGAGPGATINWTNGATTDTVTLYAINHGFGAFAMNGTLTNMYGCARSSHGDSAFVDHIPSPVITGIDSFCAGSSTTLSTSGGFFAYEWTLNGIVLGTDSSYNVVAPGIYFVTVYTNHGCPGSSANINLRTYNCALELNLKIFLEGYYRGSGTMTNTLYQLFQAGIGNNSDPTATDTILVNLWGQDSITSGSLNPNYSDTVVVHFDGTATASFVNANTGHYYIAVKHRNSLETWSHDSVPFTGAVTTYDFTLAMSKAYDDGYNPPMKDLQDVSYSPGGGPYAFYSGDVNRDGGIDILDMSVTDNDASVFFYGYNDDCLNYPSGTSACADGLGSDCDGDGGTGILDMTIIDNNSTLFLFYARPY